MLGSDNHEGDAVKRIAPGGINFQLLVRNRISLSVRHLEVHKGAFGSSDPGNLLLFDGFRIIDILQSIQKLVRILRDAKEPDILGELHHITVADVALSSLRILIGKDNLAVRAVIDQCLRTEYKAMLKQLQEDPLRPLIIIGTGGCKLSGPVKRKSDLLQLFREVFDILLRNDVRMRVGLDGIVLCRKAE